MSVLGGVLALATETMRLKIALEGYQFPEGTENVTVLSSRADEHYFDTFAIPLVTGRNFTVDDDLDAPRAS